LTGGDEAVPESKMGKCEKRIQFLWGGVPVWFRTLYLKVREGTLGKKKGRKGKAEETLLFPFEGYAGGERWEGKGELSLRKERKRPRRGSKGNTRRNKKRGGGKNVSNERTFVECLLSYERSRAQEVIPGESAVRKNGSKKKGALLSKRSKCDGDFLSRGRRGHSPLKGET